MHFGVHNVRIANQFYQAIEISENVEQVFRASILFRHFVRD